MNWGIEDFIAAGSMAALLAGALFLAFRNANGLAYLAAFGLAAGSAMVIVWVSLAVGIIGEPGNPANLVYAGVIGAGLGGALLSRLRPGGMAKAMAAAAVMQAGAGVVALLIAGLQGPVLAFNLALTGSLALSAMLFLNASRRAPSTRAI